jgi:prepilin-type N-terminal cleavage/methylation domain-containing protein
MTTRAQSRRDPQKGKKGFSKNKGFTVIELMVAVAVIAIITSLAFPSYRTLIEKRDVTSGAEQLSAFLSSARMESVKRNEQIAVYRMGQQCIGFFSYDRDDPRTECNCLQTDPTQADACAIDEFRDGTAMRLHALNLEAMNKPVQVTDITMGGGDNLVIFDPIRGTLVADDVVAMPLEVQMKSREDTYGLSVRISATGRVSVCTETVGVDYAVPGFDECNG